MVVCPVQALARRYIHICTHKSNPKPFLSTYFSQGKCFDVTDYHISAALKMAALALGYPGQGFPVDRIDTYSLRSGGANTLSLAGYSDCQIQKMGWWRGSTFKEYINKELHLFSHGMSTHMKKTFKFINIAGGRSTTSLPWYLTQNTPQMRLPCKSLCDMSDISLTVI